MLLVIVGFCVGTLGTLIGVGGGFIIIPLLLFLYPEMSSVKIASVSMWVVALNATSGSATYFFMRKVHLRAAGVFVLASLPGSVLGVIAEKYVSRGLFETIFGASMILYALVVFFRPPAGADSGEIRADTRLPRWMYSLGIGISFFVGFIAAFFGIGGGVVHVPLLSHVLGFPVHLATGTSHMILALTAWFTTAVHFVNGDIQWNEPMLWQLGLPAVLGAQVGARLSKRVSGRWILRILAVALGMVGIRLLWRV